MMCRDNNKKGRLEPPDTRASRCVLPWHSFFFFCSRGVGGAWLSGGRQNFLKGLGFGREANARCDCDAYA